MQRILLLAAVITCTAANVASATLTIMAGNHNCVLPNTANQQIQILVSGDPGEAFQGVDLYLTIGDGLSGPLITAIDVIGPGTLFNGNNFGQSDFGDPLPSRTAVALASTQTGTVGPNGVLAIVTIDTTGIVAGIWDLKLTSDLYGPSDLPPFNTFDEPMLVLVDGTIGGLCPEPSSYMLGVLAIAGLCAAVVRRRCKTASC